VGSVGIVGRFPESTVLSYDTAVSLEGSEPCASWGPDVVRCLWRAAGHAIWDVGSGSVSTLYGIAIEPGGGAETVEVSKVELVWKHRRPSQN